MNAMYEPQCMLCLHRISTIRKNNFERHYTVFHKDYEKYKGNERENLVKDLKTKFLEFIKTDWQNEIPMSSLVLPVVSLYKETQITNFMVDMEEKKNKASFIVAMALAKQCRPLCDGLFFKDLTTSILECFGDEWLKFKEIINGLSLSRRTLTLRTEVLGAFIQSKIKAIILESKAFSICLDESTDVADTSQLTICVRTVDENLNVFEALFALESFHGHVNGKNIYERLDRVLFSFANKEKLSSVCTDGAPVMTGNLKGLVGQLKKNNINVPTIHCIIHQQALFAKNLKIVDAMKVVIQIIKKTQRKA